MLPGDGPGLGVSGDERHDVQVIVRMWETPVKPGQTDSLVDYVMAEVWPGVVAAAGFIGGEVLRSFAGPEERLLLITRWQDAASVEKFLGPAWQAHQMTPLAAEEPHLAGTPFVDDWEQVAVAAAE